MIKHFFLLEHGTIPLGIMAMSPLIGLMGERWVGCLIISMQKLMSGCCRMHSPDLLMCAVGVRSVYIYELLTKFKPDAGQR